MKKIWVPKSYLGSLQVNVLMTPPVKNRNPDLILHMDLILHVDQIPQMDQSPHMIIIVLTLLFRRVELSVMNMCIILQIIMFISPRRISLLILTTLM